jgi:trehalose/maltose transport system substrate-binding protein
MAISNTDRIAQIISQTRCVSRRLAACLLALALGACHQSVQQPITLNYLRIGWISPTELPALDALSNDFMRETRVGLRHFRGVPENALDQLALTRKLLRAGSSGPDVLQIDVTWLGVLQGDLTDLRPYFAAEMSSMVPGLASSYVVGGKLLAIPSQNHVGGLEYRADLLREYGYDHPPKTWDELERMAERIQASERAKGKKDFWGYVWPGAAAESLTCNALEWQVAEGGGRIIESDATISVNNPATIRAWQRAKRWIGWISPPSVLEYREIDATNAFDSGRAAFVRHWIGEPAGLSTSSSERLRLHDWGDKSLVGEPGYTTIPGGSVATAGTLGGMGLAISKYSAHPREDATLIRFLLRKQIELWQSDTIQKTTQTVVYDLSPMLDPHNKSDKARPAIVVNRPSTVAANSYEQVSRAYFGAVHAVLTGERSAPEAAAELETYLVKITGFRTGPPER